MGRFDCPVDFDMFSEDLISDPTFYHRMARTTCPVHRMDRGDEHPLYSFLRYEDVLGQLRDPELWSSRYGQSATYTEERGLRTDPPEHSIYRRLINPIFKARRIGAMGPQIEAFANELVDRFIGKGITDLYADFANVLPVYVIAELLGVEKERHEEFRGWSFDVVSAYSSGADPEVVQRARKPIDDYFLGLLDERRALLARRPEEAPDDVLNILLTTEHPEGRAFVDDEILPLLLLLLVGGTDTSTYMLTSCVYRLLDHRSLWEQVVADPSLIEVALEESLRMDSPVIGTFRTNTRDVTVGGVEIPANSKVRATFMSANRDELEWEDPDSFRLDRDLEDLRKRHLAFGFGAHHCVGAPLARLDGRIALRVLIDRIPSVWLRERPTHVKLYQMHGVNRLVVSWNERE